MNHELKIIIADGIIHDVCADENTKKIIKDNNIRINIIDYDSDKDNKEAFEKEINTSHESVGFFITHPGE